MKKTNKILLLILYILLPLSIFNLITNVSRDDIAIDILPKETIVFTVNKVEYTTLKGTTWEEYLSDNKIPIGDIHCITVLNEYVCVNTSNAFLFSNFDDGIRVKSSDVIEPQEYGTASYILNFVYMNTAYQYERGMTWKDFINSSYNTLDLSVDGDKYVRMTKSYYYWVDSESNKIMASDKISSGIYSLLKV